MLKDLETGTVYVAVSEAFLIELAEWSAPVQVRVENGYFVLRRLAQPVKGVYIVDDDTAGKDAA
jgi:hypothetical protein